jgi:hypothetical protein
MPTGTICEQLPNLPNPHTLVCQRVHSVVCSAHAARRSPSRAPPGAFQTLLASVPTLDAKSAHQGLRAHWAPRFHKSALPAALGTHRARPVGTALGHALLGIIAWRAARATHLASAVRSAGKCNRIMCARIVMLWSGQGHKKLPNV